MEVRLTERVMFFIDARNILGGEDFLKDSNIMFKFDYEKFLTYLNKYYIVRRGYYYDGAEHEKQRSEAKKRFFNFLRKLGITLRLKEIDFKKFNHSQKGVDIFLTADMISLAYEDAYDIAIILSGDGDYMALVDLVKSKGKKVWVVSFRSCLNPKLKDCADRVILIDDMNDIFNKYSSK